MTPGTLTDAAFAVIFGTALGLGIALALSRAPRWGAANLSRRIAPYLRDIADPRGLTPVASLGAFDPHSLWARTRDAFARALGSPVSVERRLRLAGLPVDAVAFRGRQLLWAVAGLGAGGAVGIVLALAGRPPIVIAILPLIVCVTAVVVCDLRLSSAASGRRARLEEELPTVLEFLALCLSAGEGMLDALRRVGDVGAGELTAELRGVVLAVRTGSPLADELGRLARALDVPAVSRVIDQIVAAIDRGAPLAHVLQAQALDAREDAKRVLMELAGRKEIWMLFPLVFMILPLSVLFAVFPGIVLLRLGL